MLIIRFVPTLLSICLSSIAYGQSFQGSIIFSFEILEYAPEIVEKSIALFGKEHWENGLFTSHEYYVNKDSLLCIVESPKKTVSIIRQFGENGSTDIPNTSLKWSFEKDPTFKMQNLVLKKKTNEKKAILGFICRKYIYEAKSKGLIVEAWITENIPYDPNVQTKKYFASIFKEKGLILEQTRYWGIATQIMRAEKIVFQPYLPTKIRKLLIR